MDFNPTKQMIESQANGVQAARDAAHQLISAARDANDSIVFPYTNEDGSEVKYGAVMAMLGIRDTLLGAFNQLSTIISADYDFRDYHDYLRFSYKYVGGNFITDEKWSADFSHLDEEIIRLAKNLGLS